MRQVHAIAPPCPSGYIYTPNDLSGRGGRSEDWGYSPGDAEDAEDITAATAATAATTSPGEGIEACATICNERPGCTSFEYNFVANEGYSCVTYTGGSSNLKNERNPTKHNQWVSCVIGNSPMQVVSGEWINEWVVDFVESSDDTAIDSLLNNELGASGDTRNFYSPSEAFSKSFEDFAQKLVIADASNEDLCQGTREEVSLSTF